MNSCAEAPANAEPARIVLYDGVCNLCNASVSFIARRDRRRCFRFAHLQSETGRALAARHGLEPGDMSSFVLIEGTRTWLKSDAWLRILAAFGGPWVLVRVLSIVPRGLRDALYDRVGAVRYRVFGRTESCQVPQGGVAERFLDAPARERDRRG